MQESLQAVAAGQIEQLEEKRVQIKDYWVFFLGPWIQEVSIPNLSLSQWLSDKQAAWIE